MNKRGRGHHDGPRQPRNGQRPVARRCASLCSVWERSAWFISQFAGYLADGSALRRSHNRLFYRDNVELSVLTTFASQYIKYPIIAPFLHLGVFNTDYSRFGLLILHNFSGAGDAELLAYSSRGLCWSRPAIRGIASWIFEKHDLRRVTLRPPLRPISYFSYQMQVATNIAI